MCLPKIRGVKGRKIAVAMSGGVDSSVTAFLLKESGAEVFGITMKTIPATFEDVKQAKIVAKQLEIPHYVIDLKKIFEKEVIDYFVKESLKGKNPNPCVPCNQKVKFGALVREAKKLGAELVATGHYARLTKRGNKVTLRRPVDIRKDQSYVLSMLPKKVFFDLLFPIGNFTKEEVRKIAKEDDIHVFNKPENQDLCFLDKEKGDFIEERIHKKVGEGYIVDKRGNILGKHKGYIHYTVGQRKGLGLNTHKKLYVIDIHPRKNEVVVGERKDLFYDHFYVNRLNWVSIEPPEKPILAQVLVRNKTQPKRVRIIPEGKKAKVVPLEPIWAVSPGQIAVFIKKDVVLGGGWII
ncbi:MAG: tRNA 2-thiouridine(34) synthase MnmA [Nanoarchaeota archaeon]|nr:tRNA 2-thiouridine(34) synthase MnmA [Nanoarchaeota archaeon]